jgi:hypothetical protein
MAAAVNDSTLQWTERHYVTGSGARSSGFTAGSASAGEKEKEKEKNLSYISTDGPGSEGWKLHPQSSFQPLGPASTVMHAALPSRGDFDAAVGAAVSSQMNSSSGFAFPPETGTGSAASDTLMNPQLAISELNQIMERGGPEVDALLETFKSGFLSGGGNANNWLNASAAFDYHVQDLDDASQAVVNEVHGIVQQAHSDNSADGMPPLVPINTDAAAAFNPNASLGSGDDHVIDSAGDMPPLLSLVAQSSDHTLDMPPLLPLGAHSHQTSEPPVVAAAAAGNDDMPPLVYLSTPKVQSKSPGMGAGLLASTPSPSHVPLTRTVFPVDMDDLDDMPPLVTLVKSGADVRAVPSGGTGGTKGSGTNKGRKNKKQRK